MKKSLYLVINSLHGGGAERVASRLSSVWDKEYNLKIISLMPFTENDYVFCGEKECVHDYYRGLTWIGKIKNAAKRIDELAKVDKPIAIIAFLQNANLCVSYTKYEAKKILSIRNYLDKQYSGIKRMIWSALVKKQFVKADFIVSVSQMINQEMHTKYGIPSNKCLCIYNPYNIEDIRKQRGLDLDEKERLFFDNHIVLSNVGHISPQKGQFHLIRILSCLVKINPKYGVVIVGDEKSSHASKIKQMVSEYGLDDNVLFTGIANNPFKYIGRSLCYIFPSLYEGFPNALVEAMACGIPVISMDCPSGPREIIEDSKYGFLLNYEDSSWVETNCILTDFEKQTCDIVQKLSSDKTMLKTYSEKAEKRSLDFSIQRILAEWNNIIV